MAVEFDDLDIAKMLRTGEKISLVGGYGHWIAWVWGREY